MPMCEGKQIGQAGERAGAQYVGTERAESLNAVVEDFDVERERAYNLFQEQALAPITLHKCDRPVRRCDGDYEARKASTTAEIDPRTFEWCKIQKLQRIRNMTVLEIVECRTTHEIDAGIPLSKQRSISLQVSTCFT